LNSTSKFFCVREQSSRSSPKHLPRADFLRKLAGLKLLRLKMRESHWKDGYLSSLGVQSADRKAGYARSQSIHPVAMSIFIATGVYQSRMRIPKRRGQSLVGFAVLCDWYSISRCARQYPSLCFRELSIVMGGICQLRMRMPDKALSKPRCKLTLGLWQFLRLV